MPSCPAASAPRRSPTRRGKEIWFWAWPRVICQAQAFRRCETPAKATTALNPQPSFVRSCQRWLGPAPQTKYAVNPALAKIASKRIAECAPPGILGMDEPLENGAFGEVTFKDTLGVGKGLRGIDVLPVPVANVEGLQFPLLTQSAQAVRKRAIAVFIGRFEPFEQPWSAQKHSGIKGVVFDKVFADRNDVIPIDFHLGRIF